MESSELKVNSVLEVVGFLDQRSIQGDNDDLDEQSSIVKETLCIHTIQFKIVSDLIPNSDEISMLNFNLF